jgi:hypothetical protein
MACFEHVSNEIDGIYKVWLYNFDFITLFLCSLV